MAVWIDLLGLSCAVVLDKTVLLLRNQNFIIVVSQVEVFTVEFKACCLITQGKVAVVIVAFT